MGSFLWSSSLPQEPMKEIKECSEFKEFKERTQIPNFTNLPNLPIRTHKNSQELTRTHYSLLIPNYSLLIVVCFLLALLFIGFCKKAKSKKGEEGFLRGRLIGSDGEWVLIGSNRF